MLTDRHMHAHTHTHIHTHTDTHTQMVWCFLYLCTLLAFGKASWIL